MKLFILLLFFFTIPVFAESAKIYCEDQYSGEIREIDNEIVKSADGCINDLIWGKNVCYAGLPENLVEKINKDQYVWISSGLLVKEAKQSDEDKSIVIYLGIDQQSFYMAERQIKTCEQK